MLPGPSNVYNAEDNWLTRMFALEYAAWFDFLLPGLGRLGIPIPLGGTSNHFRAEILGPICGWDAFNVTEDADLGVRLARQGYRVLPIDSSTYEEATPSLGGWIRQRSRWLKGYMQTALVHLRAPVGFVRAVGVLPFLGFVIFVLGAVLTSLLSPLFWGLSLILALTGDEAVLGPYGTAVAGMSYVSLIAGNGMLTLLAMLAPLKRRWLHLAPYGAGVFLYWLLISVAAFKASWQLVRRPFYWEKTQHGIAGRVRHRGQWRLAVARLAPVIAVMALLCGPGGLRQSLAEGRGRGRAHPKRHPDQGTSRACAGSANATAGIHLEYGADRGATLILDSPPSGRQRRPERGPISTMPGAGGELFSSAATTRCYRPSWTAVSRGVRRSRPHGTDRPERPGRSAADVWSRVRGRRTARLRRH